MERGTRVGQAYVALVVDGDGVNEDIANSLEKVDYKALGDHNGKAYKDALQKHLEASDKDFNQMFDKIGNRVSSKITKGIETDSALDTGVAQTIAKVFDSGKLDSLIDHVGHKAGANFSHGFDQEVKAKILDSLEGSLQKVVRSGSLDMSKFVEGINSGSGQIELLGPAVDKAIADAKRFIADQQKVQNQIDSIVATAVRNREKLHEQGNEVIKKSDADLIKTQERLYDSLRKESEAKDKAMWAVRNATAKAHITYLAKLERGLIDKFGNTVSRNSGSTKSLGDRVGNVFGSGSRNNAIIPFQATAHAAGKVINIIQFLTGKMKDLFTVGEDGARGITKLFTSAGEEGAAAGGLFSKAITGIIEFGPGAAIVIGVVAAAASVLVSVMSALLAIVAALASTILSALAAAAAVGSAGLLALASAAGLVVIAFTSMSDAQRKVLTTSFRPIKEELTGLGQLMLRDLVPAFHTWADNIARAVALLGPLAQVMGGAFARAGSIFTASLSGPGFQMFIRQLSIDLPRITTNLSAAFGNLLNGLLALFTPVLPLVRQFSRYLAEVTDRFQRWASSAQGQNQISDFVARAVTSLRSLWGFLRQIGGLITDVLFAPSGQLAGNTIFDDMANAIRHFRSTITSANLEKWFKQGVTLAKGLGDAIAGLAQAISDFNSSGAVTAVSKTLSVIGKGFKIAGDVKKYTDYLNPATLVTKGLGAAFKGLSLNGSPIPGMMDKIAASASSGSGSLGGLMGALFGVGNAAGNLPVVFDGAATSVSNFARQVYIAAAAAVSATNPLLSLLALANTPTAVPSVSSLQGSGSNALGNTGQSQGGTKPPKAPPKFHNPFLGIANAILNSGPSISAQIKNAMLTVNKQIANALASINLAANVQSANSGINSIVQSVTASMQQTVNTARDAVQSAAQTLASASNLAAARRALAELRARQHDLAVAIADQKKLQQQIKILQAQKVQHGALTDSFKALIGDGGADSLAAAAALLQSSNLTLADFAKMRSLLATKIQAANQKLSDAINLRDSYKAQVSDSIKSFAALTTAQAQVINGITQALSSNDIISNLQDKLKQIQDFQTNLNLLLAMGLSQDAYKQIVDAGVEAGSAYAQALVSGGTGAVGQVNDLVKSTNDIADQLGTQASNRMYQAGVDAAQGLVDGLTSLSAQLDSAATRLGNSIAAAVKRALGIKSPSRVLRAMMGYVGDGIALGLDDQQPKVTRAADSLSSRIAVSPEVASYAARQAESPAVSGNRDEHHWHINTPTTDPKGVAIEAINEMTGRLP